MKIAWMLILTGLVILYGGPTFRGSGRTLRGSGQAWASLGEDAQILSNRFGGIQSFADDSGIVYGDDRGFLHVLERARGDYKEVWKSERLGSAIAGVFVLDVNADGREEIVAYTSGGQIYFWDAASRRIVWEIQRDRFKEISTMTISDVDGDEQMELIFCADSLLYIYDGKTQFEEWESDQTFTAEEIVVGDVDGDGDDEIVLNTGVVLDARFHDIEWQSPERFGDRIGLSDIDGDGIPELIAESGNRFLKVWDLDLRREKW